MTSTVFVDKTTLIEASWLNDVDALVYQGQLDDGTTGASISQYLPAGTGAVATTVQAKLRERVSVNDFGSASSAVALQTAITESTGKTVSITDPSNTTAVPTTYDTVVLDYTAEHDLRLFTDTPCGTAKRMLKGQTPASHSGAMKSIFSVEAESQGSGFTGPSNADYGITISQRKKGFAGVSAPTSGEIDGLYVVVRQDGLRSTTTGAANSSDASGILVDISNVDACGFTSAWEASTSNYSTSLGASEYSIQTQIGVITSNASPVASYGYVCVGTKGALGTAYYAGISGTGTWNNILHAPNSVKINKYGDYEAPLWYIVRSTPTLPNGSTQFTHTGTGALFFYAPTGVIQFGTGGAVKLEINTLGHLVPTTDQANDLGSPTKRFTAIHGQYLNLGTSSSAQIYVKTGTGSPEGVVTANMGSLYLNLSGGASTTLYVKQTGAGNTGWVGK